MDSNDGNGAPDLTISFVDVIANGLGCLLVLFFLTTLVRSELAWPLTAGTTSTPVESDQDPFVILVTPTSPSGRLPTAPDRGVPWRIEGGPKQNLTAGIRAGWGQDHAILVLDHRPAPFAVIRVYFPAGSPPSCCQWFTAAHTGRIALTPGGSDPWVQVWPRREGEK